MERISHYPRAHGKLPDDTIWVGRPSRWGNPYRVVAQRDKWIVENVAKGSWLLEKYDTKAEAIDRAVELYRQQVIPSKPVEWLAPLAETKNLACSCPLDSRCHADVLIEALEMAALVPPASK